MLLLKLTCSTCFMPTASTRRAELSMSHIKMVGKARANAGGGFGGGRKDKSSEEAASLTRQLDQLVAQLNAQGNELADSQRLVDQLRAENKSLRGELDRAGIAAPPASAAVQPADVLWDDGYEDDVSAFTMDELLQGKVPGASTSSPPT